VQVEDRHLCDPQTGSVGAHQQLDVEGEPGARLPGEHRLAASAGKSLKPFWVSRRRSPVSRRTAPLVQLAQLGERRRRCSPSASNKAGSLACSL
jgi:hypothetical protein